MNTPQVILFSDLDGTLLDHHTYSYRAALPALAEFKQLGIPLVINSSKTAAEIESLRKEIGNTDPYIVENGSAIIMPKESPLVCQAPQRQEMPGKLAYLYGEPRSYILQCVAAASEALGLPLSGYGQWQAKDVAAHTGLSEERARLSLQRDFSEPLLWQYGAPERSQLAEVLEPDGLHLLIGGRFTHVVGKGADKGICLKALAKAYQQASGQSTLTIALGDSPNDIAMLEAADIAVLIRSPIKPPPAIIRPTYTPMLRQLKLEPCYISHYHGPEGWAEIAAIILKQLRSLKHPFSKPS